MSLPSDPIEEKSVLAEQAVDYGKVSPRSDPDDDDEWERQESIRREKVLSLDYDPDHFDLDAILEAFVELAGSQGIESRQYGITVRDVTLHGVDERFTVMPTVGDLIMLPLTIFRAVKAGRTPTRKILHNVNAIAKPGESVLVIGRPGAGCTSFLKMVSGTDMNMYKKLEGDVRYDGIPQKEMRKHFRSDVIYDAELDVHFPHLTVEQTLKFAVACKTPNLRVNNVSRKEYINRMTEILATVLGLRHVYKTKVGNDFVRGVSGGQRKRVSIGEAMACRATLSCWDNATRGLDASTALEFGKTIRSCTNLLRTTAFVTAYQAGQSLYEQFDTVTVLYDGHQVYWGPTTEAKAYFEKMGYKCPPRQTTAEYLTAVTDPLGRYKDETVSHRIPETAEEMEAYWQRSPEYAAFIAEIDQANNTIDPTQTKEMLQRSLFQEKSKHHRKNSRYTIGYWPQVALCTKRAFQLIIGDIQYPATLVVAGIVQGLVSGSLYYNLKDDVTGAFSRGGVLFFAALYVSLMGLAEVTAAFNNRPIIFKHKNYSLYHASADAIGQYISAIPVVAANSITFLIVLYFLTNMKREAGPFFINLLFLYLLQYAMLSLFRGISAISNAISMAQGIAGFFILVTLLYSSYMIQRPDMKVWFKWISYVNPILYAFESMIATEFHGRKMECVGNYLVPHGPGYENLQQGTQACAFQGSVEGQTWVSGDNYLKITYEYSYGHVWRNFGFMFAYICFNIFVTCAGVEILKPIKGGTDRLIFLRGKVPDAVVLAEEQKKSPSDEESALDAVASTFDADREPSTPPDALFQDLKSKDLFAWKNIDYVIPYDGGKRKLLDNVFGFCKPGTLTALMGESGAGKTTLLNTLAGRNDMGVVTGDMLVNGQPLDASFSRRTGYVLQQDIHVPETTVREALYFAARLRRSPRVPDDEKREYCEKIIDVLSMRGYADAVVGVSGSGLNVEQRKKLSIAVELVAKPSLLLFLDEPTSGLDSQSAWAIVKMLQDLAAAGQSILCTIHQPSATLFEAFDRLLLLRKGGQMVYFGDIGKNSSTMIEYFEENGGRKCDPSENPAEYMLEVIGAGSTASQDADWHEVWNNSTLKAKEENLLDQLVSEYSNQPPLDEHDAKELKQTYAVNFMQQFWIVLSRTWITLWRDPEYAISKFGMQVASGLFIGFSFWNLPYTMGGAQNGLFAAFLSLVVVAPIVNMIQGKAIAGRELYEVRERKSRTYHWANMIWTQAVCELPYLWLGGLCYFIGFYFATKAPTNASHAGLFWLSYGFFCQTFAVSFALMILYFSADLEVAGVLVGFLYSFVVAFSGIVQPYNLMPGFWKFMYRTTPYTYYVGNLVSSMLHGRKIVCADKEMAHFTPPSGQTCGEYMKSYLDAVGGYIKDESATDMCNYCQYSTANAYMANSKIYFHDYPRNIGFFFVYTFFNMFLAMVLYWVFRVHVWKKK
ncbi:hypothetical protein DIURU_005454 [Diutina rugosa]|uniref:ABC transporter domain-containing protein n=1 Tax=Diutina rugosa TaxID=5481 RepID=A0A642UFJ7_DIURU|nr:uncharacterized protein DIURU_005454 [Diutina rugosa]KAA8896941.1 hypothetical protein DIURU_005454 [Diutina rugosa]